MSQNTKQISRRRFISGTAASAVGLACAGMSSSSAMTKRTDYTVAKKRTVRIAHFTDIHVEPKNGAPQGLASALHHAQSLQDKPDMLITGGDHVMDCMGSDDNWTNIQYETLKSVFADECHLPVKFCLGNHDVWGWNKEKSKTTGNESDWGKKRIIEELGLPNRYYSFSKGLWHFILLDSVFPDNDNYTARIDDEQFDWLKAELKSHKNSHVCIISHIPILSAAAFLDGECEKSGQWTLPDEWMLLDARKLKDLFTETGNVRLCISGHLHLVDMVKYNDVWYVCDGAVCGAWWRGNHMECDEGYGIFDFYDDGTFNHEYMSYGWKPIKADYKP